MTLSELSVEYGKSAELIAQRLRILRETERHCTDEAARQLLHRRILDLRPRQQQLLHMFYYDGKSVSAIARELSVNKSTVTRTLQRAQDRLRKSLRYAM